MPVRLPEARYPVGVQTALLIVMAAWCLTLPTAPEARSEGTPVHRVRYTVSAQVPTHADIYYHDADPPNFADYSHNPYQFSPKASAEIAPQRPWVLEVVLADPDQWAMVAATHSFGPAGPALHCDLAVDGIVVASADGPRGALCSLRNW